MMPTRKPAPKKPPAKPKAKPGPVEERLKIDVSFDDAARAILNKPKPPGGWPKPEPKKRDRQD